MRGLSHARCALFVLLGVALAGCNSGANLGFAVEVTLSFDPSIPDATVATVTSFEVIGSGDESYDHTIALNRHANRTERFAYLPNDGTRNLSLLVDARDGNGDLVAQGTSGQLTLTAGQTTKIQIGLLGKGASDGGVQDFSMSPNPFDATVGNHDLGAVCGTTVFCESWEAGNFSQWNVQGGSAVIDGVRPHGGAKSLHVTVPAITAGTGSGNGTNMFQMQPALQGINDIWMRTWVYMPSPLSMNFCNMVTVQQDVSPFTEQQVAMNGASSDQFQIINYLGGSNDSHVASVAMPADQWVCVEWNIVNSATGPSTLYVNGTQVLQLTSATNSDPTVANYGITMGCSTDFTDVSHDVFFDDIVTGPVRVGCAFTD
jgi:hypothetical protein